MIQTQEKVIHLIAAARPNFMKIAPLYHALVKESWARAVIVHTGQHYDLNMSDVFFQDLGLPEPNINNYLFNKMIIAGLLFKFSRIAVGSKYTHFIPPKNTP